MSTTPRMVGLLSAVAVLAAVMPTANAAPQGRAPEPAVSCQHPLQAYTEAKESIHTGQGHATSKERRGLHVELMQLRRDRDLESPTC